MVESSGRLGRRPWSQTFVAWTLESTTWPNGSSSVRSFETIHVSPLEKTSASRWVRTSYIVTPKLYMSVRCPITPWRRVSGLIQRNEPPMPFKSDGVEAPRRGIVVLMCLILDNPKSAKHARPCASTRILAWVLG